MHLRAGMRQIEWPLDKLGPRVARYKKKSDRKDLIESLLDMLFATKP